MTKLFKLKKWLTLEDSARYLSTVFDEAVEVQDLYQLALDNELTLSLNLVNHGSAKLGKLVPLEDARVRLIHVPPSLHELPSIVTDNQLEPELKKAIKKLLVNGTLSKDDESVLRHTENLGLGPGTLTPSFEGELIPNQDAVLEVDEDTIETIEGIWDLSMVGSERLDIEDLFQELTGGPDVELSQLSGVILFQPDTQIWAILQEKSEGKQYPPNNPRSYYPADNIPLDSALVIRRNELERLVASVNNQEDSSPQSSNLIDSPIGTNERRSLYRILIGMAIEKYGYKPNEARNKATGEKHGSIHADLEKLGIGVDADTIREHLKAASELVD